MSRRQKIDHIQSFQKVAPTTNALNSTVVPIPPASTSVPSVPTSTTTPGSSTLPSPSLTALVGTVNSSNKTFTFPSSVSSGYFLVADGLILFSGIDYTVSVDTITVLGQAPALWIGVVGW